jgi:RNA polymerase sigma-70 factor (ECF subfamily)
VVAHREGLARFARRLDPRDAEDLVQQALLVAWRKIDQLAEPRAARAWLTRVLLTTWLDRRAAREVPSADAIARVERTPLDALESRRVGDRVARAMAALPDEQRLAVWLVDGEGFSFAEAATALGVAPGTAASRVARARASLRAALRDLASERGFR